MQSEAIGKLLENEKVGVAIEKAMGVPFKVSGAIMTQKERIVALFDLATQQDLDDLKRGMSRLEDVLKDIKNDSDELLREVDREQSPKSPVAE